MKSTGEPEATMKQHVALVVDNHEVSPGYHRLRLDAPLIASTARAGQFVHVLPRGAGVYDPLLRRAFSILSSQGETFDFLFRVQGRGTASLASCRSSDVLDVIGPLGLPFTMPHRALGATTVPPAPSSRSLAEGAIDKAHVILVGGGVGVPPLAMLAAQINRLQANSEPFFAAASGEARTTEAGVVALIGARSARDAICLDDFERHNTRVQIATDDGSVGTHGLVTQLLEAQLDGITPKKESPGSVSMQVFDNRNTIVYACGPLPMLRSVAAICTAREVLCQVSMEENMPCGVGVCNGCVVRVANADDEYGYYRRVCVDGPVMWAHEVAWDAI